MKKTILFVIGIIVICFCGHRLLGTSTSHGAFSNQAGFWTSLGPYGGDMVGLDCNPLSPAELYAVSYGSPSQVWRSTNSGARWTRQSVVSNWIYDIAIDPATPSTIYLLSSSILYKSTDKGKTFIDLWLPSYFNGSCGRIAVHPSDSKIIIVSGHYYGSLNGKEDIAVIKTTNGGTAWTLKRLSVKADYGYGRAVVFAKSNPNYVYLCGQDRKNELYTARVYVSKDGGNTWKSVASSAIFSGDYLPDCFSLQVDPRDPKKVWVGHRNGIARTSNAGSTWAAQQTPMIWDVGSIAADSSNPKILYAGCRGNSSYCILKSTDGGITWRATGDGDFGMSYKILASGLKVHQATQVGIFVSKNGGTAWKSSHNGICAAKIFGFAVAPSSPNTIYAGVRDYALLKTLKGGSAWTLCAEFAGSDYVYSVVVHPSNPNTLYVKPYG